jgi:hypothetical protein
MCHLYGALDITPLCRFVAADQQQINHFVSTSEVHPVTRAVVNTHFVNGVTDKSAIAKVAMFGCSKSGDDSAFADDVFQRVEPFGKYTGSFEFDHVRIVFLGIQAGKPLFDGCLPVWIKGTEVLGEGIAKNSRLLPQNRPANSQIKSKSGKV